MLIAVTESVMNGNWGDRKRVQSRGPCFCRAAVAAIAVLVATVQAATPPVVETKDGAIEGLVHNGVEAFLGIPFAAPPIAKLRWRDPQPVTPWKNVLLATKYRPACMQVGMYPPDAPTEPVSENCLYLNIWKPAISSSTPLPVMVWIYGGALENGSAAVPLYAGNELARHGVIIVTVNYRLGAFGFLALPALTAESTHHRSGDYGLLDQIAALKWVHQNIGAFGGDAGNVTVFGQSSGSISISALTASPIAKGLFQKAIGESGGLLEPMKILSAFTLKGAQAQGEQFMRSAGVHSLDALRDVSANRLLTIPFVPHIIIDGYALPRAPWKTYEEGKANRVRLLIGWNADSGTLFLTHAHVTPADYDQVLDRSFPSLLVRLLAPNPGQSDRGARAAAVAFNTDMRFRWDMWRWATLARREEGDHVYLYEFARSPPYPVGAFYHGLGATHGVEMQYVFDHLQGQGIDWTAADRRLAVVMPDYWTRFARTGDPNMPGLPRWPGFSPQHPDLMRFATDIHATRMGNLRPLRGISRIYGIAEFVVVHWISLILAIAMAISALFAAMTMSIRRR